MTQQEFKILFLATVPQHAEASHLVLVTDDEKKAYKECVAVPPDTELCYPSEFSDADIPDGSIAYHPVFGSISYKSWWRFSTKQFIADIKAADENPAISAHLIHIDSCGGEAFGLHEAFLAVKALKKPVYALVESVAPRQATISVPLPTRCSLHQSSRRSVPSASSALHTMTGRCWRRQASRRSRFTAITRL